MTATALRPDSSSVAKPRKRCRSSGVSSSCGNDSRAVAGAGATRSSRSHAMPTSATHGVDGDRHAHAAERAVAARELRAPDRRGDIATAGSARPRSSARRSRSHRLSLSSRRRLLSSAHRHATSGNPAITATVIDDRERDEVPVERDVRDIDVVPRRHAPGEPAREAVELHDHPDGDVQRRPEHQHPDRRRIDVARRDRVR